METSLIKVDLYDVLNGDLSKLKQLRSGDSIIVKPVKDEIRISGEFQTQLFMSLKVTSHFKIYWIIQGLKSTQIPRPNCKLIEET